MAGTAPQADPGTFAIYLTEPDPMTGLDTDPVGWVWSRSGPLPEVHLETWLLYQRGQPNGFPRLRQGSNVWLRFKWKGAAPHAQTEADFVTWAKNEANDQDSANYIRFFHSITDSPVP